MKQIHGFCLTLLVASLVGGSLGGSLVGCLATSSGHTTATATVLKVYSATDAAGHNFIAYIVNHNGVEVVISDALARSSHKVGDSIKFMEMKMQLGGGQYKTIAYSILPS